MPPKPSLKRGLKRESCDFCYTRKIRCDRAARQEKGHGACSQCELRQVPCILQSDDIRISRPPRVSAGAPTRHVREGVGSTSRRSPSTIFSLDATPSVSAERPDSLSQNTFPDSSPIYYQASPDTGFAVDLDSTGFFHFNSESISFLDSIFMQGSDMPESFQIHDSASIDGSSFNKDGYQIPGVDMGTLEAALDAYFDLASLALPILHRDAFMVDYRSGTTSFAVVCAVACRGSPFLQMANKWSLQQTFAQHFREAFLGAREAAGNMNTIRLDDIEALALMVDFSYTENSSTSIQDQLGALLLTHDSLVLMALQYEIQTWSVSSAGQSVPFRSAAERKRLLFWHVYGRDAFRCLNSKTPSRIHDDDVEVFDPLQGDVDKGYLDTILGVAIVAREITQTFCHPAVRRRGAKSGAVGKLYEHLDRWRIITCPPGFFAQQAVEGSLSGVDSEAQTQLLPLHRAMITLLEHDCYMQLEHYVEEYGIDGDQDIQRVILEVRIDYETLRTACSTADLTEWLQLQNLWRRGAAYSLADLAPDIVRDICAGTCFWLADRGKKFLLEDSASTNATTSMSSNRQGGRRGQSLEKAESFATAAIRLRDAVATAKSHQDTIKVLERLDTQLGSLKEIIQHAKAAESMLS